MSGPRETLGQRLAELRKIQWSKWENIELWARATRPLVVEFYPNHKDDFDRAAKAPFLVYGFRVGEPESERVVKRRLELFAQAHAALVIYIETLLALPTHTQGAPMAHHQTVLAQKLEQLKGLKVGPEDWSEVTTWAAGVHVLIAQYYSNHLKKFEAASSPPQWSSSPMGFTGGIDDEPFDAESLSIDTQENTRRANTKHAALVQFIEMLVMLSPPPPSEAPRSVTHINNITNSTVGAFASHGSAATGHVAFADPKKPTQSEHVASVKVMKKALAEDEAALQSKDGLLEEALHQFLLRAAKIQVEISSIAETQAKMKETLDEVWAEMTAKGMKPAPLKEGLHIIKTLSENPLMQLAVKSLLGLPA